MTETPMTAPATEPPGSKRALAAALAAGGLMIAMFAIILTVGYIPVPQLQSLADAPDPSLGGTVAYLADGPSDTTCLMVVPASGGSAEELTCTAGWVEGVSWTTDGRLAIVVHDNLGPSLVVVDPTTGRRIDTIAFEFERPPSLERLPDGTGRTTSRDGRTLHLTTDGDGHVGLTTTTALEQTTLVDLTGPRDYDLRWASWSPDDQWILFGDSRGRLMVVNSEGQQEPRLLAEAGARRWQTSASWLMPDVEPGPLDLDEALEP